MTRHPDEGSAPHATRAVDDAHSSRRATHAVSRQALLLVLSALFFAACSKSGAKDDEKAAEKAGAKSEATAGAKPGDKADEKAADTADGKAGDKAGDKADEKAGDEAKGESKAVVAATTEKVAASAFAETVDGSGTVSARTGHLASLSAPAPTRITAVNVAIGDRVKRGDALVTFETTAFDAAVTSSDAALKAAEQAADRAHRLVDAGVSPRKDAELADAELAAARANSVNARRAQQLGKLQSPLDGVVTRLSATLGANVDAGQMLVEIADTRTIDVLLVLAPALAAKTRTGMTVDLRDGTASDAPRVAQGRIADVSAVVDSASRGVVVRVAVGEQKRTLRLGETLYGRIVVDTHKGAVVIPDIALVPTGEGFHVFVVDAENKAHARPVTIGGRDAHRVWIADGLKAGETIVTAGAYGMDDGATVTSSKPPAP